MRRIFLVACLFSTWIYSAQLVSAQSATTALSKIYSAFSNNIPVSKVTMTGTADWTAGSLRDSGAVTLSTDTTGAATMTLALATTGNRIEQQTGLDANAACSWSGNDGVSHSIDGLNCWRPTLWFLPAFRWQPTLLSAQALIEDLGVAGSGSASMYQLQAHLNLLGLPSQTSTLLSQESTTNVLLDPSTMLPAALYTTLNPDSGISTPVTVMIVYSQYAKVNGVNLPFRIQRYLNGSLQLDITISSAQIQ